MITNPATAQRTYENGSTSIKTYICEDPSAPIEARIAFAFSQMTPEETLSDGYSLYGSGRVLKMHGLLPDGQRKFGRTVSEILMSRRNLSKFGSEISYPYANSVKNRHNSTLVCGKR